MGEMHMNDAPNNRERRGIPKLTRRGFLKSSLMFTAAAILAACGLNPGTDSKTDQPQAVKPGTEPVKTTALEPTPACGADHSPSPALTEGPYFTPNSPERTSLYKAGMEGVKLTITGYVMSTDCVPIKHALLDFWQADHNGQYDNKGYTLRGHQYTDDQGKYTLETIIPGLYPGRTRHVHVKVQAPSQAILTTQLFFPNEAGNAKDGIFNKALVLDIKDNADSSKTGLLNFILKV
jgi:protocatechuate 3,4-dioxygenase beta subunit